MVGSWQEAKVNAEEFLKQYNRAQSEVSSLDLRLQTLYDNYQSPRFYTVPRAKGVATSGMDVLMEKREEIRERLIEAKIRQMDIMNEICQVLSQLSDPQEFRILTLRYIDRCSWREIEFRMCYSYSRCQEIKRHGIRHVQEILDRGEEG